MTNQEGVLFIIEYAVFVALGTKAVWWWSDRKRDRREREYRERWNK